MTQKQALKIMQSGHNVFLTGPPGTGKTYLLKTFIDWAKKNRKKIAITASTGIAASQISGTTFHSWSSIGLKNSLNPTERKILTSSDKVIKKYQQAEILIIDEISMLDNVRFDLVNDLAQEIRGNDQPFGGIQLILVGDFFQLPPINQNRGADFVFKSKTWYQADLRICYLNHQHRQEEGDQLLDILIKMRTNQIDQTSIGVLKERIKVSSQPIKKIYTELYSHNIDVDQINSYRLSLIKQDLVVFPAETKGKPKDLEKLLKNILVPVNLELKIGCQIMMVINNFKAGYFNGSLGEVIGFKDNRPIIRLQRGPIIVVEKFSWKLFDEQEKLQAEVIQFPIRLAWAITIHKSQGMSLDVALIDLTKSFSLGMGYVALSRVRSLDGLYLKGFNDRSLQLAQEVYDLDFSLRYFSKINDLNKKDLFIEELDQIYSNNSLIDQTLLEKLIDWRTVNLKIDSNLIDILPDSILEIISVLKPFSRYQLESLPGMNSHKIKKYARELLVIVQEYALGHLNVPDYS